MLMPFVIGWYDDINSFLQQGNAKKSKKKIFISSERVEEYQWNFQERCDL